MDNMSIDLDKNQRDKLVEKLKQITHSAELDALAIVTREGLNIAFFASQNTDPDLLSAVTAASLATGSMVTEKLSHGEMTEMIIRGKEGFSILSNAGPHFLIGASREHSSTALTTRIFRQFTPDIMAIMAGAV
jgi:hypothetical protein